jgi:hypothetical protein
MSEITNLPVNKGKIAKVAFTLLTLSIGNFSSSGRLESSTLDNTILGIGKIEKDILSLINKSLPVSAFILVFIFS